MPRPRPRNSPGVPQLAAFPKAYLDALCVDGSMTLAQWIGVRALVSAIQRSVSLDGHTLPVRLQREWSAVYGNIADFATSAASSS